MWHTNSACSTCKTMLLVLPKSDHAGLQRRVQRSAQQRAVSWASRCCGQVGQCKCLLGASDEMFGGLGPLLCSLCNSVCRSQLPDFAGDDEQHLLKSGPARLNTTECCCTGQEQVVVPQVTHVLYLVSTGPASAVGGRCSKSASAANLARLRAHQPLIGSALQLRAFGGRDG